MTDKAGSDMVALCTSALDLLEQQVDEARSQTDAAVLSLSQRFAELYGGLEKAVRASDSAAGDGESGMSAAFGESRETIGRVVESLRDAFRKRDASVQQVRGVTGHASALQTMVERVAALAAKTDLLALNATIEAARAGEHGRGFSIVAEEVRKLSAQSRQTSREMSERVGAITSEIRALSETAARLESEEKTTFAETESALGGVIGRLEEVGRQQGASAAILRDEGERMRQEIAQVMVALQFGDRVNQILGHACSSLRALHDEILGSGDAVGADAFLERMAGGYTTEEQRRHHAGGEECAPEGAADEGHADITFF